jgi:hypothetical protein
MIDKLAVTPYAQFGRESLFAYVAINLKQRWFSVGSDEVLNRICRFFQSGRWDESMMGRIYVLN